MINKLPSLKDVRVFVTVAHCQSFSHAAIQLNASRAYVSKRIKLLEKELGIALFFRSARAIHLTEEGAIILRTAEKLLADWHALQTELDTLQNKIQGSLRISCSTGFGMRYLNPFILTLRAKYPDLHLNLTLSDHSVDLMREGIDVDICIGGELPEQYIAQKLIANQRIFCAAPSYIERYGQPDTPEELESHLCITLRERNQATTSWTIENAHRSLSLTPQSYLSVNNGDVAKQWCLKGEGILLRSFWSLQDELAQGQLIHLLPTWYQCADVYAIYPQRLNTNANLSLFLKLLKSYLATHFLDTAQGHK